MENKILDLTKMDDESFKIVKTAVEDMVNNGTNTLLARIKMSLGFSICHLMLG